MPRVICRSLCNNGGNDDRRQRGITLPHSYALTAIEDVNMKCYNGRCSAGAARRQEREFISVEHMSVDGFTTCGTMGDDLTLSTVEGREDDYFRFHVVMQCNRG